MGARTKAASGLKIPRNAKALAKYRTAKNISQEELGNKLKLKYPKQYIYRMERGIKPIKPAIAKKLAKILGCEPEELVDEASLLTISTAPQTGKVSELAIVYGLKLMLAHRDGIARSEKEPISQFQNTAKMIKKRVEAAAPGDAEARMAEFLEFSIQGIESKSASRVKPAAMAELSKVVAQSVMLLSLRLK